MPCFILSTNVNLDGVDTADFFSEATKAVASIIGKPENVLNDKNERPLQNRDIHANDPFLYAFKLVMVVLKGSVDISFGGNKEPAAFSEIISMGGITPDVKRKLIATLGTICENRFSIPRTRFFLKVYDTTMATKYSKL